MSSRRLTGFLLSDSLSEPSNFTKTQTKDLSSAWCEARLAWDSDHKSNAVRWDWGNCVDCETHKTLNPEYLYNYHPRDLPKVTASSLWRWMNEMKTGFFLTHNPEPSNCTKAHTKISLRHTRWMRLSLRLWITNLMLSVEVGTLGLHCKDGSCFYTT